MFVYAPELREPELMYKLFDTEGPSIFGNLDDLLKEIGQLVYDGTGVR